MNRTKSSEEQKCDKHFIVVLRGPSAVIFQQNKNIFIKDFQSTIGPVNMAYTSRWLSHGSNVTLPGHLWIEIAGNGPSLEEVLVPFANAGLAMLPTLALCTNAAVGEPEIELGFENTPGVTERDYFQCYVPPETDIIHICRHIKVDQTVSVIRKLATHNESERLRRGTNQYRLALDSWRLGREMLALAHLWMALEAIIKAKITMECSARGLNTPKELADSLGIQLNQLDPTVRKELILKGDNECYSKGRQASDGFEHGYLDYRQIRERAKDVRHRMASYIRLSILEMLDLDKEDFGLLKSPPFDKPIGYWPVVKYYRGKLVGKGDRLAAEGNAYPFLRWKPIIKAASAASDGEFKIKITDSLTAELAEGISFRPQSFEAWQAE